MIQAAVIVLVLAAALFGQTGGSYSIERSVILSGGAASGGGLSLISTVGQPAAGRRMVGGRFVIDSGFWTPELAPTAASVAVGGRVRTSFGGVANAVVMLTDMAGRSQIARTNGFGYFRVDAIEAGQIYIVSVSAKGLVFPPVTISVLDEISDLEIIAVQEND